MSLTQIHPGGVLKITPDNMVPGRRATFVELRGKDYIGPPFPQVNLFVARPFFLHGMHFQTKSNQMKMVRCVHGEAFSVYVDVRKDADTFGTWVGQISNDFDHNAVFVPAGFAVGFVALVRGATVLVEMTEPKDETLERRFSWNDSQVGIKWPFGPGGGVSMDAKDRGALPLSDVGGWEGPDAIS